MNRIRVKCSLILLALLALTVLIIPSSSEKSKAFTRCTRISSNYVLGENGKGAVKVGACGCTDYFYLCKTKWPGQHSNLKAAVCMLKNHTDPNDKLAFHNGFPQATTASMFPNGKLGDKVTPLGAVCGLPKVNGVQYSTSCYFYKFAGYNIDSNSFVDVSTLNQKSNSRDAMLDRTKNNKQYSTNAKDAVFCIGHDFGPAVGTKKGVSSTQYKVNGYESIKIQVDKQVITIGAFKREYNEATDDTYAGDDDEYVTYWMDLCSGDMRKTWKDRDFGGNVFKNHKSMCDPEDLGSGYIPKTYEVALSMNAFDPNTYDMFGHTVDIKGDTQVKYAMKHCAICGRLYYNEATNAGTMNIDGTRAYDILLQYGITEARSLFKESDRLYVLKGLRNHHLLRLEVDTDGKILDNSGNPTVTKENYKYTMPIVAGKTDPYFVYGMCLPSSRALVDYADRMSDLSIGNANAKKFFVLATYSYCYHVEALTNTRLIVDYHISNLQDSEPTKDGRFSGGITEANANKAIRTAPKPTWLNVGDDGIRMYVMYHLANIADYMDFPAVECAVGKNVETWQTSPLKDNTSSSLHEAVDPLSRNIKITEGVTTKDVHGILTGIKGSSDHNEVLSLKESKYALSYNTGKVDPYEDYTDCHIEKGFTDSLLHRSVLSMNTKYSHSNSWCDFEMTDSLTTCEKLPEKFEDVCGEDVAAQYRDYRIAQLISSNIILNRKAREGSTLKSDVVHGLLYPVDGASNVLTDMTFFANRGLTFNKDGDIVFDKSTQALADYYGIDLDPIRVCVGNPVSDIPDMVDVGAVEYNEGVKRNLENYPGLYSWMGNTTFFKLLAEYRDYNEFAESGEVEYTDVVDDDNSINIDGTQDINYFNNMLPSMAAYDDSTGHVKVRQFNTFRAAIDGTSNIQWGAEAQSNAITIGSLYANIDTMRYIVNCYIDNIYTVNKYVIPAATGYHVQGTTQYQKDAESELWVIDSNGQKLSENEYVEKYSPGSYLYRKLEGRPTKARCYDIYEYGALNGDPLSSLDEYGSYFYGLLYNGWWHGDHAAESAEDANVEGSEGDYQIYGKPVLLDQKGRSWYYTASDAWTVADSSYSMGTYSNWLLKKKTIAYNYKVPANVDLCSTVTQQDIALTTNQDGETAATDLYGQADMYAELKPKSYSIRYIVNDKYANAFDETCEETGKDNYFEDKNYYDGKAHYFDATQDTPVNYHDRKQGSSKNRGTKWTTGGNYPKAYKQGYYLAGWKYYGDDFHEYGTVETDDKDNPTGFIAVGDKIQAFQYYPKYEKQEKNIAYLYAVWKPYEYTIVYKGDENNETGTVLKQKKPFGYFYEDAKTGEMVYDLFTNTVGTFASTPVRKIKNVDGKTVTLDVDAKMTAYPHFKKFGHYISSWEGVAGKTGDAEKKQELGAFKKSEYYTKHTPEWSNNLNKAYAKPKSGVKYTPDGGTVTKSNVQNTRAKAKYLQITEDLLIPGDETYNHLPENIEPRGHNLKVTYTAKWSKILYNVVYRQDSDGTNGAISSGSDILTGNYTFGKVYNLHRNPKTKDGWDRLTAGGKSTFLGWCFVDKDTGLHPHYKAGSADNVAEVQSSTEESSIGTNFYTKSKTKGSWAKGMNGWSSPYTQDHNYGNSAIHGGNMTADPNSMTYQEYFDYLHDDCDPAENGKVGTFPLYAVWDDKAGWEPQDLHWSFQKMADLINSNGGRNSQNAMKAVESKLREAEMAVARGSGVDREHNDPVINSNTYTDFANHMRIFEFEKTFEDICKMTFDNYANTEGRAASAFDIHWYYHPDNVVNYQAQQRNIELRRRKLYLTDSYTWRNLQIERARANGQAVTQNENLPWAGNFYKVNGRGPNDLAVQDLDEVTD